jgi:hypothetical protein
MFHGVETHSHAEQREIHEPWTALPPTHHAGMREVEGSIWSSRRGV